MYAEFKSGRFFFIGSLEYDMGIGGASPIKDRQGLEKGKNCSMSSVKKSLNFSKNVQEACCDGDENSGESVDTGNCSIYSDNVYLRYEMTKLGDYVSILEFDMAQRYYRYLDELEEKRRARVMTHLRVMVFIPFK